MAGLIRLVPWLVVRRLRAFWLVMLAAAVGVLLAATLSSAALVHSGALGGAGLRHALASSTPGGALDIQIVVRDRPIGRPVYDSLRLQVEEKTRVHAGPLFHEMHRYGHSRPLPYVLTAKGVPATFGNPTANLFFQSGFRDHTRLVSGRWPEEVPSNFDGGFLSFETALGAEAARQMGWDEDTVLFLAPFGSASLEKIAVTVVGIVEPEERGEPYWFGDLTKFQRKEQDNHSVVPLYVSEESFFNGIGAHYPMLLGTFWWYVFLDLNALTPASASHTRADLEALESGLNQSFPRTLVLSALGRELEDYERRLSLAKVPLFLFTSLVIGVVFFYLLLLTGMIARERGREIALLRSRGASQLQIGSLVGMGEGLLVALPAVVLGPFFGWIIGREIVVRDLRLAQASAELSPSVFVVAIAAALVSILVFTVAGWRMGGGDIVERLWERTHAPGRPALYRYSFDLLLLGALGFIWWQIQGQGGFLTQELADRGVEVDLSLLLGPGLVFLAAGLVLMRLLPYFLRLLALLVEPLKRAWLTHGLKRMARDPLPYGSLAVLLMLATALGVFGATFGATLAGSQVDQVRYAIGGEVVVSPSGLGSSRLADRKREVYAEVPGVRAVTSVYRGTMSTGGGGRSGASYSLLAVEPESFPETSWFRDDFSEKGLQGLLAPLRRPLQSEHGAILPGRIEAVGVWVRPEREYPGYTLWARLRDVEGRYESLQLGGLGIAEWSYLEATLTADYRLRSPFSLVGVFITGPRISGFGKGSLAVDDILATIDGERVSVEGFEAVSSWRPLPNAGQVQDSLEVTIDAAHSGRFGAIFEWTHPIGSGARGLFSPPTPMPLPAIGSNSFALGQELVASINGQSLPLSVEVVTEYFPTLYPNATPFLVVNQEHLNHYRRSLPGGSLLGPSEFWVSTEPGVDRQQVVAKLSRLLPQGLRIRDQEKEVRLAQADPLGAGAWDGPALLALATLGGIVTLGFLLWAALAVRRARLELGLLRVLGFSLRQTRLVLTLESVLVLSVGIGVGTLVGIWMGSWTIDYLDLVFSRQPVVPPINVYVDWRLAALSYLEIIAAGVLATLLALMLAARPPLYEVLRVDE